MKLVSVFTKATPSNWWPHRWSDGGAAVVMPDNLERDVYFQVAPDLIYSPLESIEDLCLSLENIKCES